MSRDKRLTRRQEAGRGVRAAAARTVAAVRGGDSLTVALPGALIDLSPEDRALVQHLAYGTLRWAPQLELILEHLLDKPMRPRDSDLQALALIGLFQLIHSRVPDYAAVSATVEAARVLGNRPWAGGFVNALLRRFERERESILVAVEGRPEGQYAHPGWMIDKLREDWPAEWEKVIGENNRQPPMVLRVALDRQSREQCMQRLRDSGFDCRAHPLVPSAVELDRPAEVSLLPGFAQGLISVQDAGAQLAAGLLAAAPGQRVLDACAAPGGKTVHLLEATPALEELVALDQDERRLARLRENLARCSRQATPVCADLRDLERWWDGQYFDRVLLDAPCSASGVVRRHPDIKCLRRPGDLAAWSARQSELLQSVWRVLAPGGILLYVTCSVFRAENQSTLACFLEHHPDAAAEQLTVSWGRDAGPGRQILPGETGMDGFYYACLKRQPD